MKIKIYNKVWLITIAIWLTACKIPTITSKTASTSMPKNFALTTTQDSTNIADLEWRTYFNDPYLIALVDTALQHNQELNIVLQEIAISNNEIMAKRGEYLPFVQLNAGALHDRSGKYTWNGFNEEDLKANPDKGPKYFGDFMIGATMAWELDVWKKLRTAKKSAVLRYLATTEGKHFLVTNIIAEIANSYYELMALDNMLAIIRQNIAIQSNALQVVKLEKDAAKVSQLAVNRFEAQLLNTQNLQYAIEQQIIVTENTIRLLTGQTSQRIERNQNFEQLQINAIAAGYPSQLLSHRPDVRQAELEVAASKLDVAVARANFLPSFRLTANMGLNAFNPTYVFRPDAIMYQLAGDAIAPFINRKAIEANYRNANAKQIQAAFNYERTIVAAYLEVINQLSSVAQYNNSYTTKAKEVAILTQSINISNDLFRSARADYIEVLLTQKEALDAKIELTEIKLQQLHAHVNIYKALGGGWK
ncbi:MAG TPA: RND transporter [Chitinophagaceae bacterium]|nr:RND transporter [Chitinophagaceae bacterium]